MQPEVEEALGWLSMADRDLEAAQLLAAKASLSGMVCFHAQQAAEKAVKALLTGHKMAFPFTHNLVALRLLCLAVRPAELLSEGDAQTLTNYAVSLR